jgi:predicted ArsR family transcriptional regulator
MEPGNRAPFDDELAAVALLAEPVRRALYAFVRRASGSVSRDEAAEAVGIQRSLAAFHLDRLAEGGLLTVEFRRLSGRTGPGAGRPAKLYRRSDRELNVRLPARDYEGLARLLTEAMTAGESGADRLTEVAAERGRLLAEEAKERARGARGQARLWEAVFAVLDEHGFEPRREGARILLGNCPFAGLARDYPDVVCQANVAMVKGIVDALGAKAVEVRFDPVAPGVAGCCVSLAGVPRPRP